MDIEVLTRAELIARCGTVDKARGAVKRGYYRRVVRGAYVDGVWEDSPEVRLAVLRVMLPAQAALSHRATLWLLGRDVLQGGQLDVTVERDRHLVPWPGVSTHIADLPDDEVVEHDGLLRLSVARAVVDVARTESLIEAVAFGDEALRSGAATEELILESLERAAGLRGVIAARLVPSMLDGRSESPMESRLRVRLVEGGIEDLDVQHDVYDESGHAGRADLHVKGVLLEYDGREERLKREKFTADRQRQNRLSDTGSEIRRFTASDVYKKSAARLAAEVRRPVGIAATRTPTARKGPDTLRPPEWAPLATRATTRTRKAA